MSTILYTISQNLHVNTHSRDRLLVNSNLSGNKTDWQFQHERGMDSKLSENLLHAEHESLVLAAENPKPNQTNLI